MKDSGICPDCNKEFEVTPEMYWKRIQCPYCKEWLDISPDDDITMDTALGQIGITFNNHKNMNSIIKLLKFLYSGH